MPQVVFVVIVLVVLVVASRRVRSVLLHAKLWHFIRMFLLTLVVMAMLAAAVGAIWYWWTVIRVRAPSTNWTDKTIEMDEHPETPGAGGPRVPTIVR